jgi:hypothetical protein
VTDGLIITSDRAVFDEFNLNFSSELTNFEYAQSVQTAREALEWEMFDYLLIIEEKIEDIQAIMQNLQRSPEFKKLPVLCCTANTALAHREMLWNTLVKDIIFLPISKEEFRLQLESFLHGIAVVERDQQVTGMQGKLEDYNLLDLIQTLDQNKKTGILTLYHGRDEGRIWFMNGRICEAKFRTFENLAAIFKLVTWLEGDFTISFVEEEYEPKIEQDNQQILLECIQYIDHRNKLLDNMPDLNESLLISPETDIVQMETEQANYLRFFQGGQTITGFLSAFDQDELKLLQIVKEFAEKQHLMNRDVFDSYKTEQEREVEETGLKNVFKKFFRGKEGGANKTPAKKYSKRVKAPSAAESEKNLADRDIKFEHWFIPDNTDLVHFKQKIEKL